MSHQRPQRFLLSCSLAALLVGSLQAGVRADSSPSPTADHPTAMQQAGDRLLHGTGPAPENSARLPASTRSAATATASASVLNREFFGFAQYGLLDNPSLGYTTWNLQLLTTLAYFGLHVSAADGSLMHDNAYNAWASPSSTTSDMLSRAYQAHLRRLVSVIYQDSGPTMCQALQHYPTTVNQIVAEMQNHGLEGINVDYEGAQAGCGPTAGNPYTTNQQWLTAFIRALRAAMPAGKYLAIDTYAGSAGSAGDFFDIAGLAPSVNAFFVMAYELDNSNWSQPPVSCSSRCMAPTSPASAYRYNDAQVAADYARVGGAGKTILGLPYYGWAACVNSTGPNATVTSNPQWVATQYAYAKQITQGQDPANAPPPIANHRDAYDAVSPWATWQSPAGVHNCAREMYWDDATSLGAKFDIANRYGLAGAGAWSLDYAGGDADLWTQIATHFSSVPAAPTAVTACPGNGVASVSWTPPTNLGGAPIGSYTVYWAGTSQTVPGNQTELTASAPNGSAVTFSVRANNAYGGGAASDPSAPVTPSASLDQDTSWMSWYDSSSVGMYHDNVHLLSTTGAAASGCVLIPGVAVAPFSLPAGGLDSYVALPPGTIGGPVKVTSSATTMVSQRVTYFQTFDEAPAQRGTDADTSLYFAWYDRQSAGMNQDNVHVVNPQGATAHVSLSIPGVASLPTATIGPGQEAELNFPAGTIGGPVKLTSDVAVLASQRVTYWSSFNEVPAMSSASAATSLFLSWFDKQSAGMFQDNVHLINPSGGGTVHGTVKVGSTSTPFTVGPNAGTYVTLPAPTIGGPVVVSADAPVLAAQRVTFYSTFNEVVARPAAAAAVTQRFHWFDSTSTGMYHDNLHVLAPPGGPPSGVDVTVSLGGSSVAPQTFHLAPGQENYVTFAPGQLSGPVTVTATGPVLASQRVTYYNSFNEVAGRVQ